MPRRAAALIAVATAAAAAVLAPGAGARVVADIPQTRTGTPAGPALAGRQVVWAQRRGRAWAVYAASSQRARRLVQGTSEPVAALAASADVVAIIAGGQVRAGRLRGPLLPVPDAGPGRPRIVDDGSPAPAPAAQQAPGDEGCGTGVVDLDAGVAVSGWRVVVVDGIPRCDGAGTLFRVVERDLSEPGREPRVIATSTAGFDRVLAAGPYTGWTLVTQAPAGTPSVGGTAITRAVAPDGTTAAFVTGAGSRYTAPLGATALDSEGTLAVAGHAEDSIDSTSWVTVQAPGAFERTLTFPADQGAAYGELALDRGVAVLRRAEGGPRVAHVLGASAILGGRTAQATGAVATDGRRVAWLQDTRRGWRVRLDAVPR